MAGERTHGGDLGGEAVALFFEERAVIFDERHGGSGGLWVLEDERRKAGGGRWDGKTPGKGNSGPGRKPR